MIKIKTIYSTFLELNEGTTLSMEDNSRANDSNSFAFDYQDNISLPFAPNNNELYRKIGLNTYTKIEIYSDGMYIGRFYAKITERLVDINTYIGSYKLEILSLFYKLSEDLQNYKIRDTYKYQESVNFETFIEMRDWVLNKQLNPNPNDPYQFPRYSMVTEVADIYSLEDSMEDEYGNIIEVNYLNENIHPRNQINSPEFYVKDMILYRTVEYKNLNPTQWTNWLYHATDIPRRPWSLVVPCFNYIKVLQDSFMEIGYELEIKYDSTVTQTYFENLLLLNNYNIFNCKIFNALRVHNKPSMPPAISNVAQSTIEWNLNLNIDASHHLPNISLYDLLNDFIVKTGATIDIEDTTITIEMFKVRENNVKKVFHPKITTKSNQLLKNKVFKYDYTVEENNDNIPNYTIDNKKKESDEITSIIVPIHHRRKITDNPPTPTSQEHIMSYIIGDPYIDRALNEFSESLVMTDYQDAAFTIEIAFYGTQKNEIKLPEGEVPKFCSNYRSTDPVNYNFYMLYDKKYIQYDNLQAFDHSTIRNLWWTKEEKGLIDTNYKDKLLILMAIAIHSIKVKFNIEEYQKFKHHHFFSLLGRRVFPLNRKYTLPLSLNNEINYECYETED